MPKSYYPPEPLTEAIKVAKVIADTNNGHPMHKLTLAEQLGVKSEGRKYRDLITASAGYGFTKESYKSDEISILPPSGVNLIAFFRRFQKTCWSRAESAQE